MNELYEYISWSMNGEMLLHHSSLGVTFSIKACTMLSAGSPVSAHCDQASSSVGAYIVESIWQIIYL